MPPPCFFEKRLPWNTKRQNRKSSKRCKKLKTKSKFYFNDLAKILEAKPEMPKKSSTNWSPKVLEYWSSGSTSMYGMSGTGKQAAAEHED